MEFFPDFEVFEFDYFRQQEFQSAPLLIMGFAIPVPVLSLDFYKSQ